MPELAEPAFFVLNRQVNSQHVGGEIFSKDFKYALQVIEADQSEQEI